MDSIQPLIQHTWRKMENIQTEEETRPITGRKVVQAYSTNDRRK